MTGMCRKSVMAQIAVLLKKFKPAHWTAERQFSKMKIKVNDPLHDGYLN